MWESLLNLDLVQPPFAIDADGAVAVPQAPGLGIELDEDVIAQYRMA